MTAPTPPELQAAAKQVKTLVNLWDLAMVSDTLKFDLDAIEDTAAVIIESIDKLKNLTTIKSQMTVLNDTERSLSLKCAIATIAADLRGGVALPPDSFKSAVERACDPGHKEFWMRQSSNLMVTLISEQDGIADILKGQGVLVWSAGKYDPADNLVRIVNTKWLTEEAEIFSFVVSEPPAGKTCRFCLALEPPESLELQPLDPEQRSQDVMIAGMSGKRIAILQPGRIHCHVPCAPYWRQFLAVAERLEEGCAA